MPRRLLREGILRSKRVNALSFRSELFFRRLMSVVDDFGRYEAEPEILVSACFPINRGRICDADATRMLRECTANNLITVYEASDSLYLEIHNFNQEVRSKKSKFPDYDATQVRSICDADATQMGQEDVDAIPETKTFFRSSDDVSSKSLDGASALPPNRTFPTAQASADSAEVQDPAANVTGSGKTPDTPSQKKQTAEERAAAIERLLEFEQLTRIKNGLPTDPVTMAGFRRRLDQGAA